ncbi:multidrug ABC transporter ATP-binding protein [Marinitoga sp. 1135]|uniref:ABC-type multidrug transport system, ATPase and permease component n=1 Tax=Marinitoga piezophila (strain DSM 14283 / JCM 11233 / KA3) TaxID=443254 RepID=H2J411_MARPK|nr:MULTISPECIES: ABC transporter ATP-binding protein [Marinitoga]AEX84739.1 ABC-type multidrug transport system, ATPase and permease component [Marinitoga piezophila KA3]APT75260.1 multidrug ABC transporter ATP-binding protein [Marinitoga sp. 1137]NUU95038.1 multidrug ABC transporter ATP-binding protein [Marinitoga sp. 1135]
MNLKFEKTKTILRIFSYLKPFFKQTIMVIFLMIIVMGINLINPYFFKIAIDKYIANNNLNGLIIVGVAVMFLNLLSLFISRMRIILMGKITNKIVVNIRHELYEHIQKLSFSFFDTKPVGKILARVVNDVNSLQQLFSNSITSLVPEFLTLVFVAIIMFSMNFKLALASMIILPFLLFGLFLIENISRKRWMNYRKNRSELNAFTHEDISGIRIIKSFTAENKTNKKFRFLTQKMMNSFVNAVKINDWFWAMVLVSWGIGSVVVFYLSTKMIDLNEITVGTVVAFIGYIGMFWRPIMNLSNFYNSLVTNISAAERIFEILDTKPLIVNSKNARIMPEIKGKVEFKNVYFSYDKEIILKDMSFKVNAGETIALVGPTGAGKTTVINLISRFYDPQKGKILIDGIDIKNVDLESLRSQMGIMLQDTFLFSDTIKENIRYGKLDATDEEIINVAKAVHAHEFIMKLEKGYDTKVNERGVRLSIGERQLISFARALLANPKILILDEATSNIDTHTEKLVQDGIKKLLKGRTSFVIAHRLSTIRNADRIFYIDNGKIIESGNHDELMSKKGFYYNLYLSQFKFLEIGA